MLLITISTVVFVAALFFAYKARGPMKSLGLMATLVSGVMLAVSGVSYVGVHKITPTAEEAAAAFGTTLADADLRSNGGWFNLDFDNATLACDAATPQGRDGNLVADCTFTGDLGEYTDGVGEILQIADDGDSAIVTLSDRDLHVEED